jgi:hypothetical protein
MFKEQAPSSHRVPAPAGLKVPESKLLSGFRSPRGASLARDPNDKIEARQRVHASAFSEILRRVPGRMIWTNQLFRSF